MLQEIGNPLRVLDIGFPPWYRFDMLRIDQQQLKMPFKQVLYRFPVYTRTLHRSMGTACRFEPIQTVKQLARYGPKGPNLFPPLPIGVQDTQTSDYDLLVNINPAATWVYQFHVFPHKIDWMSRGGTRRKRFSSTCLRNHERVALRQTVVPESSSDQTLLRAYCTREVPIYDRGYTLLSFYPFSSAVASLRLMGGSSEKVPAQQRKRRYPA